MLKPTIMKFGGTSVEDGRAFERVSRIVHERAGEPTVVVVSAMSRMTDALLASVQAAASGQAEAALRGLEEHFARHLEAARELLSENLRVEVESAIESARGEIGEVLRAVAAHQTPRLVLQDVVVSYGERLSATLLAAVLCENGLAASHVDARRLIMTNDEHECAARHFLRRRKRRHELREELCDVRGVGVDTRIVRSDQHLKQQAGRDHLRLDSPSSVSSAARRSRLSGTCAPVARTTLCS